MKQQPVPGQWGGMLLLLCAVTTSCVPTESAPSVPPSPAAVSYPHGLNADTGAAKDRWYLVGITTRPQAGNQFTWPEFAKEEIPRLFIERMNLKAGYKQFALADGPSNFKINLTLTEDETRDHYGVEVHAEGPPTGFIGRGPKGQVVPNQFWFSFTVNPSYRKWESAVNAAADKAAGYLINGWTY
jgi:hypothetical protein